MIEAIVVFVSGILLPRQMACLLVLKILLALHGHLSVRSENILPYLNDDHVSLIIALTWVDGNQQPLQAEKAATWHHIFVSVHAQFCLHFQGARAY